MSDIYRNFAATIGAAQSKQTAFLDHLGPLTWQAKPDLGIVDLGHNRIYQLNLLGSWSRINNTWRWYWVEETRREVHPDALVLIDHLKAHAGNPLPKEFGERIFSLKNLHPAMIPMTILAMFEELHAIFELPYAEGKGFVALRGCHAPIVPTKSLLRLHTIVQEITTQYPVKVVDFLYGCADFYDVELRNYGNSFQLRGEQGRLFIWADSDGYFDKSELEIEPKNRK